GIPNAFGVMGYDANAPAPGKRMLSSMTPTFMVSPERVAVLGTPGGSRIITMVLLGILGYDAGLDAQAVAALPRYHHQWMPEIGDPQRVRRHGLRRQRAGAGQAHAQLDDPDLHGLAGTGGGAGYARRFAHHHHGAAGDPRLRRRPGRAGGGRAAALPPPVDA